MRPLSPRGVTLTWLRMILLLTFTPAFPFAPSTTPPCFFPLALLLLPQCTLKPSSFLTHGFTRLCSLHHVSICPSPVSPVPALPANTKPATIQSCTPRELELFPPPGLSFFPNYYPLTFPHDHFSHALLDLPGKHLCPSW